MYGYLADLVVEIVVRPSCDLRSDNAFTELQVSTDPKSLMTHLHRAKWGMVICES